MGGRCSSSGEQFAGSLKPYNPAILLLDADPGKMKTRAHTKTRTQMLPVTFFRIVPKCYEPTRPLVDECIIPTMGYYLAIRNNDVLICATGWVNLENVYA